MLADRIKKLWQTPCGVCGIFLLILFLLHIFLLDLRLSLPFTDMLAFSLVDGLNSHQAFGEFNYYQFQYSYITGHAFLRALSHLVPDPQTRVHIMYAVQIVILLLAVWKMLGAHHNGQSRMMYVAAGGLAFASWLGQGLNLWGGPFYFSFGVVACLALYACLLSIQHPSYEKIILFSLAGLFMAATHPFLMIIVSFITAAIVVTRDKNKITLALAAWLSAALYSWLVVVDQPMPLRETLTPFSLLMAKNFGPELLYQRFVGLVDFHQNVATLMLGAVGENFFALSWLIAGVVVLGSFAALWALVCNGRQLSPHHRSVFALTLACFVYYMICPDEPYHISMWPYRFLLFSTPVALVSLLLSLSSFRATITIPAAALAGLMFVIASYIALVDSEWIAAEANKRQQELISQILASNAKNCLMHMPGVDAKPFFMNTVTFFPFLAPELRQKNIYYVTMWHKQPQHNLKMPQQLIAKYFGQVCVLRAKIDTQKTITHITVVPYS